MESNSEITYNVLSLDQETGEVKRLWVPNQERPNEEIEVPSKKKKASTPNEKEVTIDDLTEFLKIKASKSRLDEGFFKNFLASFKSQKGLTSLILPAVKGKILLYVPDTIKNPIETVKECWKEKKGNKEEFNKKLEELGVIKDTKTQNLKQTVFTELEELIEKKEIKIPEDNVLVAIIESDNTLLNKGKIQITKKEENQSPEDFVRNLIDSGYIQNKNVTLTSVNASDYQELKDKNKGRREDFAKELISSSDPILIKNKNDNNIYYSETAIQDKQEKNIAKETAASISEESEYIFDKNKIQYDTLEAAGLSKKILEDSGVLEKLLKGDRSELLDFARTDTGFDGYFMAKLQLNYNPVNDTVAFKMLGIQHKINIPTQIGDYRLTSQDKKMLEKTGNLFKPIPMDNGKTYLIGLDKEIKTIVARDISTIKDKGLSAEDLKSIQEGKITAKNIFFDVGKDRISVASKKMLNDITQIKEETKQTETQNKKEINVEIDVRQSDNKLPEIYKSTKQTTTQSVKNEIKPKKTGGRKL